MTPIQRNIAAAFGLAVSVSACGTGNVQVSAVPTQLPAAGASNAKSPSDNSAVTAPTGSGKVVFERVTVANRLPTEFSAISYLSLGARPGTAPYSAFLLVPQSFSQYPIFAAATSSVAYLRSTGVEADSLVSTTFSSFEMESLFAFPKPVRMFAIAGRSGEVAWVDRQGWLAVAPLGDPNAAIQATSLGAEQAQSLQWNTQGTRILVRTAADALLFAWDGKALSLGATVSGVAAAAFAPDGTRIAYVSKSDRSLHIRSDAGDAVQGTLESGDIHDFGWDAAKGFTYWVRLQSGAQEIRLFGVDKASGRAQGPELRLARLGVPASVTGGVVCPSWIGGSLYYGDSSNGQYVILKAAAQGRPTVIAQPISPDEGFVCPHGGDTNFNLN